MMFPLTTVTLNSLYVLQFFLDIILTDITTLTHDYVILS